MTLWRTFPQFSYTEVGHFFCLKLVLMFRRSISDLKMLFRAFWGANGWPSPRGPLFLRWWLLLMTSLCWGGSLGVHIPPESTSTLRPSASWVITALSILGTSRPPETLLCFISQSDSASFVFQQVMRKSKAKELINSTVPTVFTLMQCHFYCINLFFNSKEFQPNKCPVCLKWTNENYTFL